VIYILMVKMVFVMDLLNIKKNKIMLKFLKNNAWALWLGMGTQLFFGYSIDSWKWWAFCIPLILLVGLMNWGKEERQ
jgi:hypothetical protein